MRFSPPSETAGAGGPRSASRRSVRLRCPCGAIRSPRSARAVGTRVMVLPGRGQATAVTTGLGSSAATASQTPKAVGEAAGVCPRTVRKWVSRIAARAWLDCAIAVRGPIGCIGRRLRRWSPRSGRLRRQRSHPARSVIPRFLPFQLRSDSVIRRCRPGSTLHAAPVGGPAASCWWPAPDPIARSQLARRAPPRAILHAIGHGRVNGPGVRRCARARDSPAHLRCGIAIAMGRNRTCI